MMWPEDQQDFLIFLEGGAAKAAWTDAGAAAGRWNDDADFDVG